MTTEQFVAILGGLTALVIAIAQVIRELRTNREMLNGRLSEMLTEARTAALKEGELRGRDHKSQETDL